MKDRQATVDWIKVVDGHVRLDSEALWDLLGTPYDYTVNGAIPEITMFHMESIGKFGVVPNYGVSHVKSRSKV